MLDFNNIVRVEREAHTSQVQSSKCPKCGLKTITGWCGRCGTADDPSAAQEAADRHRDRMEDR